MAHVKYRLYDDEIDKIIKLTLSTTEQKIERLRDLSKIIS